MDQIKLCRQLLKQFSIVPKNITLYLEACTHNSYAYENNLDFNYQRLEFLGDAVLGAKIALYLYHKYSQLQEGSVTTLRQKLVRGTTLAKVARNIGLDKLVLVGKGERRQSSNKIRSSICSDVYESFLGAIYLDKGYQAAHHFIEQTLISQALQHKWLEIEYNYKSKLMAIVQTSNQELRYVTAAKEKRGSVWHYEVNALLNKMICGIGAGETLKEATQKAAQNCLAKLSKNDV